jgi:hypothetical protein
LAPSPDDFTIVEAYYGEGAQYVSVTSAVRDRLKSGAPDFVIDNAMFGVNRDSPYFEFVLTYLYRGKRSVLTAEKGEPVTLELLAANAFQGSLPRNGDEAPLEWLLAMRPDPPLDPDITGPGTGPEPRKELGIVTLIRALGELNAVEPRFSQMASELAPLVRRAIADAEANIEYPFPPASMKPPALARLEDDETRLGKAVRSLFEARMLLGAADPGRNADALAGALDKIDQALAIIDSR